MNGLHTLAFLLIAFGFSSPAMALLFLEDHFDNGSLDPAWAIDMTNASSWTASESGTRLTATDIVSSVLDSGGGGVWATVSLTRSF